MPDPFDKEGCLPRAPYLSVGAEWGGKLMTRPFEVLPILLVVKAACDIEP